APFRQYVARIAGKIVGRVQSVDAGRSTWCNDLKVDEGFRRKGIGRALLARMLRDDRDRKVVASVLLASHAGALLYPHVGYRQLGATGATSNPIIISDLIKTGRFDAELGDLMKELPSDDDVAWQLTDKLVRRAQEVFAKVHEATKGNDGYVSFELDPLLEDAS